ncbi:MAG: hypothetical protein PHH09_13425 [Methanoregulaceae archaeon]|nr:hypothetical protein [Methanoregulaceae archaeon]
MADTTFSTVLPALKAHDNGDGTYSMGVVLMGGSVGAGLGPATDFTISGGAITLTSDATLQRIKLIPEGGGGAGADTINTINGGSDGDIVILQAKAGVADPITVDHSAGNCVFASDFVMNNDADIIALMYDGDLSKWIRIWYQGNA